MLKPKVFTVDRKVVRELTLEKVRINLWFAHTAMFRFLARALTKVIVCMRQIQKKLEELDSEGICVFENVLDTQQLKDLRSALLNHLVTRGRSYNGGNTQNDAINVIEDIQWVINGTLFADIVRAVVGDDAVYAHHSDALHNTYTGWHRDHVPYGKSDTALDFWGEDDRGPYRVFKFAFYLQDHRNDNTALKYLRGSHKESSPQNLLKRIFHYFVFDTMQPAPGSLVVFDQRLLHNGVTPSVPTKLLLKCIKSTSLKKKLWDLERKVRGMQDRVFIQIAFGRPGNYSDQHAMEMVDRQQIKTGTGEYQVSSSLKRCLKSAGLGLASTRRPERKKEEAQSET